MSLEVFEGKKQTLRQQAEALFEEIRQAAPHIDNDTLIDYCQQISEIHTAMLAQMSDMNKKMRDLAEMNLIICHALLARKGAR